MKHTSLRYNIGNDKDKKFFLANTIDFRTSFSMKKLQRSSLPEQVAKHLREGIQVERWSGALPGEQNLAKELDVSRYTVRRAFSILEKEGILGLRGQGCRRGITKEQETVVTKRALRILILRHDAQPMTSPQAFILLAECVHSLEVAGH